MTPSVPVGHDGGLSPALLSALVELDDPQGVSMPRLAKHLGLPGSAVLRGLHLLSGAAVGGQPGPGWVRVAQDDSRWLAWLTDAGRQQLASMRGAQESSGPEGLDDEGRPLPTPLATRSVQRHPCPPGAVPAAWEDDAVAAEVPVALVFNGLSHAVMMATPADLHAFALGFALSEGIIDQPGDCHGIEVHALEAPAGVPAGTATACEVRVDITARCFARLKDKRRSLAGRTGCGVCGIDSLQALDLVPERVTERAWAGALPADAILRAVAAMPARQSLNAAAGAVHAAGWATPGGELTDLLEDVGRHNALDKLIGQLAAQGRLGEDGFVVMSSRASYELVRKCARLDIPLLAAVSAPTSLAIDLAQQAGITLWGLCRPPRAVRYGGAQG
ncbi:formate dehydrogenase accessory sulfurtransferase FdhD [Acidovorax sp. SUPP3434]|uniref:formate dehydrogenase accessory sulfurtransferase FdhD n=1 Tax=Acidovorax sp. SUPP3434 TaxID=2920880 RepID=UPI0023DE34E5|nr:formate dehydrogenase accessory sulfurtransferase FdhD [Acidovorax sp. SUPP3434]GKS99332.1 formate dehydrogenase accessory sulfurtransferase FdhD [Acidovorax sp. SUPP3434]